MAPAAIVVVEHSVCSINMAVPPPPTQEYSTAYKTMTAPSATDEQGRLCVYVSDISEDAFSTSFV